MNSSRNAHSPLIVSLFASALLLFTIFFHSLQETKLPHRTLPHYRIAIVSYSHQKHIKEMIEGYTTTLNACPDATFECKWHTANEDRILLKNITQKIQNEDSYDLILCIGMAATYAFIESAQRKEATVPAIFTAVITRMWKEWSTKYTTIRDIVTGTVGEYDWETRSKLLLLLRPDTSHIIVPYTPPFDGNDEEIGKIHDAFKAYNITLKTIPLEHNSNVPQKIAPFLPSADALLLLRDAVALGAKEQIIKKCNQQSVTIFSADIESIKAGVAAGLCISEQEMGTYPARQSIEVLVHKKKISEVPLIDVGDNGSRFVINESALQKQNIDLSEEHLFLIKNGSVVRSSKDTQS